MDIMTKRTGRRAQTDVIPAASASVLNLKEQLVMEILSTENLYRIRKRISGVIFGACAFMSSCNGSETTWTAESRSPDGKIIATAQSVENSGFGIGGGGTTVFLNWTMGSQPATEIFEIGDVPKKPGDRPVEMKWLTLRRLELTYKGNPQNVGFQATKWADVDISVRNASSNPPNAPLDPAR
jgi:hypothetical protein